MKKLNHKSVNEDYLNKLKEAATKLLLSTPSSVDCIDIKNAESLIHELHTYQIELELQNNELQQAQIKLHSSLNKYSDLFDFAPNGYMTINSKGLIVEVNKMAAKMLLLPVNELLKKTFSDFIIKEDQDIYYHFHRKLINTAKEQVCELRMKAANNTGVFVQLNASADNSIGSEHGPFRVSLTDISNLKFAQQQHEEKEKKLNKSLISTIYCLGTTVEFRDPYTSGHQKRVSNLALLIAQKMGLSEMQQEGVMLGAYIHDIGKIHIPAEILNRPGRLYEPELQLIKMHPQVGADILKETDFPWPITEMIVQHHERLDGSGYPNGLKGEQIILEAQIIAVADVVEAIHSHRPYRPALGLDVAIKEIQKNKNILYNSEVVDICIAIISKPGFDF